jgi:octaprenyl-diphosphate synthase
MLIHALSEVNKKDKKKMMTVVGNEKATQKEVLEVIDLFKTYGSLDYAQNKLNEFREKSKKCLELMDSSESKNILIALTDYNVNRMY